MRIQSLALCRLLLPPVSDKPERNSQQQPYNPVYIGSSVSRKAVKQEVPVINSPNGVNKAVINRTGNHTLCRFIDGSQSKGPDEDRNGESDDAVSVMTGCGIDKRGVMPHAPDPNDYLINAIMEALDVYERMSISLKLARGRTVKANNGDKPAGVCPYGYRYTADRKHIEPDPDEAKVVKMLFTEGQKGLSLHKIADMMNEKGITTRRGKEWSAGSVQVVLRNSFYAGILTHQGKEIKGNHEALISKVQFGKVQSQISKRKRG